jgi:hypothetical protein
LLTKSKSKSEFKDLICNYLLSFFVSHGNFIINHAFRTAKIRKLIISTIWLYKQLLVDKLSLSIKPIFMKNNLALSAASGCLVLLATCCTTFLALISVSSGVENTGAAGLALMLHLLASPFLIVLLWIPVLASLVKVVYSYFKESRLSSVQLWSLNYAWLVILGVTPLFLILLFPANSTSGTDSLTRSGYLFYVLPVVMIITCITLIISLVLNFRSSGQKWLSVTTVAMILVGIVLLLACLVAFFFVLMAL